MKLCQRLFLIACTTVFETHTHKYGVGGSHATVTPPTYFVSFSAGTHIEGLCARIPPKIAVAGTAPVHQGMNLICSDTLPRVNLAVFGSANPDVVLTLKMGPTNEEGL